MNTNGIFFFLFVFILFMGGACTTKQAPVDQTSDDTLLVMVPVELINPLEMGVVVTFFNLNGIELKTEIPSKTSKIVELHQNVYSMLVSTPDNSILSQFPPENITEDALPDTINYALEKDTLNARDFVRYSFRNIRYNKENPKGRVCMDVSFDSTHFYAITQLRWLFQNKDSLTIDEIFAASEKEGYPFIDAIFRGNKPFFCPQKSLTAYDSIPETIDTYYGVSPSLYKVYQIPSATKPDKIKKVLFQQVIKEAMSR